MICKIRLTMMNNQWKGVLNSRWGYCLNVCSIKASMLNMIQKGIAPIQSVFFVVNGQAVGPPQKNTPKHHQIGSIQISSADVGWTVPFRVKHISKKGKLLSYYPITLPEKIADDAVTAISPSQLIFKLLKDFYRVDI